MCCVVLCCVVCCVVLCCVVVCCVVLCCVSCVMLMLSVQKWWRRSPSSIKLQGGFSTQYLFLNIDLQIVKVSQLILPLELNYSR